MITRSDIEFFANRHKSFFDNDLSMSLSGEACFIFETGLSKNMNDETRHWIQTYLPVDEDTRYSLLAARNNAYLKMPT